MYYKIKNKKSEVYKKLYELRKKELQIEDDNEKAINEKIGLKYEEIFGYLGQQNHQRVTQYSGFCFLEPEKVDLKIWKKIPEEIYVPNTRTKKGKEMEEFLSNSLQKSNFDYVIDILGLEDLSRFKFPFVKIAENRSIYLFLDDKHEPENEDIIEITKKEFSEIKEIKHKKLQKLNLSNKL